MRLPDLSSATRPSAPGSSVVKRFRAARLALVLALSAGIVSCGEEPTSPSHFAPFSQTDLVAGTGDTAASANRLDVHYTLWLYDAATTDHKGVQIETSRGQTPFSFVLGSGEVIEGWNQGLTGMRVGGQRRLVIPPSLAYGQERKGIIPPNATLLFDIELVSISTS